MRVDRLDAGNAERRAALCNGPSRAAWRSWLHEGPGHGLKRQHAMSRIATGWVFSPVGLPAPADDERIASPFASEDDVSLIHNDEPTRPSENSYSVLQVKQ